MVPPLALRIADAASAPRFGQIEETQGEAVASRLRAFLLSPVPLRSAAPFAPNRRSWGVCEGAGWGWCGECLRRARDQRAAAPWLLQEGNRYSR